MTSNAAATASLPMMTALIGSGGFIIGLYSFVSPYSAARIYGIPIAAPPESTVAASTEKQTSISKDEAYVYAHGSRNFAIGTSILGLTAYWRFSSLCRFSPIAVHVAKRCIGIAILAGSMVPIADAYVILQHVKQAGLSDEDVQRGKKAGTSHAIRSVAWLAGALACLLT
jgi:Domain of unknown function (DUF4267)